jgi:hypothetical protein
VPVACAGSLANERHEVSDVLGHERPALPHRPRPELTIVEPAQIRALLNGDDVMASLA